MSAQEQLLQLITDTLKDSPKTAKEASILYETLLTQLTMCVASTLPSIEAKLFLTAKLVQEVEEVSTTCFSKTCACNFLPIGK